MLIAYTHAMVCVAIAGDLGGVPAAPDPVFGVGVPLRCPGVPEWLLQPRSTWTDQEAYDRSARELASRFAANFARFAKDTPPEVVAAGPRAAAAGQPASVAAG